MIEDGDNHAIIWFLARGDVLHLPAARKVSIWDAVIALEREATKQR